MMRLLFTVVIFSTSGLLNAQSKNGFDLDGALIPRDEIRRGGPPRDGIPSIDRPLFDESGETAFADETHVLGVYYKGVAKAYPISILNWHEIVNDDFSGTAISVTYCPLCGSGMAYIGDLGGKRTTFGVSGLLYNSDVLLYDRLTNSLWSQILNKAVTGEMKGRTLTRVETQRTTLGAWKRRHPDTQVLSISTGFVRDYQRTPYGGYDKNKTLYFPVSHHSEILHEKEWVIGLEYNGKFKAWPVSLLAKRKGKTLVDDIGGRRIVLKPDENAENVVIEDEEGNPLIGIELFWFAWYAFHPETEVWNGEG